MENKRTNILNDAIGLVNGPRQKDYGKPEVNFSRIAARWSQHLGITVTPYQVCLLMAELKLARLASGEYHEDSLTDGAAYLALAAEMHGVGRSIASTDADRVD